ncbi:glycosyltransferase family 2 protein [Gigaspora margarita]|uniref:Chitin synthase n=1 Tax=Gigaspora margarita TaxID=4874 RepID=A0A8H4AAP7_GIGMA|nr:glycosyltransferase family 2 protein [Gigaspora margarita]
MATYNNLNHNNAENDGDEQKNAYCPNTCIHYIACTSEPDNFKKENYTFRHLTEYKPDLFILITMNYENKDQLSRILDGVKENIDYLHSSERGDENGLKIAVCIVSNVNKHFLEYLPALGGCKSDIAESKSNVRAHLYEYTPQFSTQYSKESTDKVVNFQTLILFCLKEEGKYDDAESVRWFFNAFCPIINPKICVLVKAGVKPDGKSIYNLWKAFSNTQVAGACGKLVAMKERSLINLVVGACGKWVAIKDRSLINPVVGAQIFENEISNILDKPFESLFGYIQSLPEEFSAYRYSSLQAIDKDILSDSYLKYNYLLCFALISIGEILYYESSSQAEIDISSNLSEFIHQQICCLNQIFFARFYAITHFSLIWKSKHSPIRKICLLIKIIHHAYNFLIS